MLDFIGIGAQKCGTSWLYEMLRQHPDIGFPAGKEVHFWDNSRFRGLDWYKELPAADELDPKETTTARAGTGLDWYKALFAGDDRRKGEISPSYACLPAAAIEDIRNEFPDVRLIFIIRNPIERTWSAAKMMLARSEMTVDEASDQWFIDFFKSRGAIARSDYAACLQNWLAVFPRDQLLIERYENISAEPSALLDRCSRFIGVRSTYDFSRHEPSRKIFPSEQIELRPSLRVALRKIYADKIRSLSDYLQDDFSSWV